MNRYCLQLFTNMCALLLEMVASMNGLRDLLCQYHVPQYVSESIESTLCNPACVAYV